MGNHILALVSFRARDATSAADRLIRPIKTYPLAAVPDEVRKFLETPPSGGVMAYGFSYCPWPARASYLTVTENSTICMIVQGDVTRDQAETIRHRLTPTAHTAWPEFQDIVEDVLGDSVNRDHPKGRHIAEWLEIV